MSAQCVTWLLGMSLLIGRRCARCGKKSNPNPWHINIYPKIMRFENHHDKCRASPRECNKNSNMFMFNVQSQISNQHLFVLAVCWMTNNMGIQECQWYFDRCSLTRLENPVALELLRKIACWKMRLLVDWIPPWWTMFRIFLEWIRVATFSSFMFVAWLLSICGRILLFVSCGTNFIVG